MVTQSEVISYNFCPHFKGSLFGKNCDPFQICHFIDIFVALANKIDLTSQISINSRRLELFKPADSDAHFFKILLCLIFFKVFWTFTLKV